MVKVPSLGCVQFVLRVTQCELCFVLCQRCIHVRINPFSLNQASLPAFVNVNLGSLTHRGLCFSLFLMRGNTVMRIIKLNLFPVPVIWISSLFNYFFAIFKNAIHTYSLKPGETPSYSASHQAPNYVQRYWLSKNTLKRIDAVAVRLRLFFQLL